MKVVGLSTTNSAESISEYADKVIADYSTFDYNNCIEIINS